LAGADDASTPLTRRRHVLRNTAAAKLTGRIGKAEPFEQKFEKPASITSGLYFCKPGSIEMPPASQKLLIAT
jgi:hypothetical protein